MPNRTEQLDLSYEEFDFWCGEFWDAQQQFDAAMKADDLVLGLRELERMGAARARCDAEHERWRQLIGQI